MTDAAEKVVKEGWLLKRGEYIASWRPRYFILRGDGTFRGFKNKPAKKTDAPINFFDITNSTVTTDDSQAKKSKFGFTIRFMQVSRVIERTFHLDSTTERDEWMTAYKSVKQELDGYRTQSAVSVDERMRAVSFIGGKITKIQMAIDDFDMLKVLGKGTFGKVMLAKQKKTGDIFAIKVLKKSMVLEKDELAHTLTENSVLAKCQHPFLTELRYSFQTMELLCFVLEYVNGGEIFFHLSNDKRFSEDRTRFYIAEISLAVTYLHDAGIIYRDLKLENLMLDRDGHIKITDFGLCKENITAADATTTFCGTPEYLAPEVIEDSEYGRAVDWWGVGVVMYEMITGMLPFRSRDHEELFGLILSKPVKVPPFMSANAKDAVLKLLDKDPKTRLGGDEGGGHTVLKHPFFNNIDLAKLEKKEIPPPFVPTIGAEDDVSNFDTFFTSEPAKITPPDVETPVTTAKDKVEKFKEFKTV
jgi:RAC serine/threonine-protein kinase